MNSGIPARDVLVQPTGQITTIWLIFFERLYSFYQQTEQSNIEGIEAVRKIANDAKQLAQQAISTNTTQQKQIDDLHKLITDSSGNFATTQDLAATNKRVEQTEYDIQQLQDSLNKLKNSLSNAQQETANQISNLQDQINNIARSTFIDAPVDGKTYGRKDLEWTEIIAVSLSLPFWLADGSQSNIQLTPEYQLPFWLSDGTQQNIQMVVT